jgi:hypothetical protein
MLEWLIERVHHWQREVERARREVARAEADLRQCEASGYRDRDGYYHRPDCSHEVRVLARAVSYQQECEGNLRVAQAWRSRLEQAVDEYRREVRRLYDAAGGHTEQARAFLNKIAEHYEEVRAAEHAIVSAAHAIGSLLGVERAIGSYPLTSGAIRLLEIAVGRWKSPIGQLGEDFAQIITEDELGLKAMKFDKRKHGFDCVLQGPAGQIIVLESKTDSNGKLVLERRAEGYKQGSIDWVKHVARQMTDRSSELWSADNERVGRQILEADPKNVGVLATVINRNTGLAEIYKREDGAADDWRLLIGKVPVGEEL